MENIEKFDTIFIPLYSEKYDDTESNISFQRIMYPGFAKYAEICRKYWDRIKTEKVLDDRINTEFSRAVKGSILYHADAYKVDPLLLNTDIINVYGRNIKLLFVPVYENNIYSQKILYSFLRDIPTSGKGDIFKNLCLSLPDDKITRKIINAFCPEYTKHYNYNVEVICEGSEKNK